MRQLSQIVITTEEAGFAEKLRQVLHSNHSTLLLNTFNAFSEMKAYLEDSKVSVVIVDIDPNPQKMLRELDSLAIQYPSTRFAVASSESSKELMLEAMLAGVRHFMDKKSIEPELDKVLERLLVEDTRTETDVGMIITVLSASGGCGATTISLNLANELRLKSSKPVLAIDLDNCYGAISSYLGITSHNINEVLRQKDRIDGALISTSAFNYKENFDVLTSSAGITETTNSQYPHLAEALVACKEAYRYIIIDAPRTPMQMMKTLSSVSKAILVVFQPNVKDIKIAKNIINALRGLHISSDKIFPLVNRFRQWIPPMPFEEVQKAVGAERLYRVRNDYRKIINCVNRGEPLSELAPRSGIRRDFQKLATNIYACHNGNGNSHG
jgi:pilus assembly protein CpaE